MLKADGTPNKANLGANAILGSEWQWNSAIVSRFELLVLGQN
jgi:hypothetical protein